MATGLKAKPMGYAFANIGERGANANLCLRQAWGKDQYGYLLTRVVGSGPGWIIAVIGREHQQIVLPHGRDHLDRKSVV